MMEIKVNGQVREIEAGLTLAGLLEQLGIEPRNLALELNGEFLDCEAVGGQPIRQGDTLEVVRFVGGG